MVIYYTACYMLTSMHLPPMQMECTEQPQCQLARLRTNGSHIDQVFWRLSRLMRGRHLEEAMHFHGYAILKKRGCKRIGAPDWAVHNIWFLLPVAVVRSEQILMAAWDLLFSRVKDWVWALHLSPITTLNFFIFCFSNF